MSSLNSRIERESKTVSAMIALYCHKHHGSGKELCIECLSLEGYARQHLQRCPFQAGKTTCVKCPMHCFNSGNRDKIRMIMRYAGPRMLYRHPLVTVRHLIDGRRQKPVSPIINKSAG